MPSVLSIMRPHARSADSTLPFRDRSTHPLADEHSSILSNVTRPIEVVIVQPVADLFGGAERMLWLYLEHHDRSQVSPTVVLLQPGTLALACRSWGVPVLTIDAGRLRHVWRGAHAIVRLAVLLRRQRPDLVLSWMGKGHPYAVAAAGIASLPRQRLTWWQHSIPDGNRIDRIMNRLPAAALGASSHATRVAQHRLMRPQRPMHVVHPGVPDDLSQDAPAVRDRARRELNISDGECLVGMIARFQEWKGQHRFVAAMALLRDRGIAARGLLVGGDPHGLEPAYTTRVLDDLRRLRLSNTVTRIDQVADPRKYFLALDIFVNVSVNETLGLAVLEAMCAQKAIVAVDDGGGVAEIIDHNRSGLLLARADPELLAEALSVLIRDSALRGRLAAEARGTWAEGHTAVAMAANLDSTIVQLARDPSTVLCSTHPLSPE
jgi:glycosyltransferase involved in cell wall biosynthesis